MASAAQYARTASRDSGSAPTPSRACRGSSRANSRTLTATTSTSTGTLQATNTPSAGAAAATASSTPIFAAAYAPFSAGTHPAWRMPARMLSWSTKIVHDAVQTTNQTASSGSPCMNARSGAHRSRPATNSPAATAARPAANA